MARKTGVEGLAEAIDKILDDYGEEVANKTDEITKKVGRKAAKALREESASKFNGEKYAGGWSVTFERDQLISSAVIHNKKLPGLPHLLEKGHAKRGGGRVDGRIHIKPVEDEVNKLFEDTLRKELR